MANSSEYAARLEIDYPEKLDRLTTFFRLIWIIPIAIILGLISGAGETVIVTVIVNAVGEVVERSKETAGGLANGLAVATALMIVFRQRYPRWWFDFSRELVRFGGRVGAYLLLLTDRYPSTVEEQSVHLNIDYPDAKRDLNRWLPLVKWLLVIPHVFVLFFLNVAAFLAVISAWFAILTTGRYPRGVFDFIVGVGRWYLRVAAYALLLVIDRIHHSACASNYRNKLNDCFHLWIQPIDATLARRKKAKRKRLKPKRKRRGRLASMCMPLRYNELRGCDSGHQTTCLLRR